MSFPSELSKSLRAYYAQKIMSFRDEPDTGDFFAEYYLLPLFQVYGEELEYASDARLHTEYMRAPLVSGFLAMGLVSGCHFLRVAAMSTAQLEAYRTHCRDVCSTLAEVDLNDPPGWLAWLQH